MRRSFALVVVICIFASPPSEAQLEKYRVKPTSSEARIDEEWAIYAVTLREVTRSTDGPNALWRSKITRIEEGDSAKFRFEDGTLSALWFFTPDGPWAQIKNTSQRTLVIAWDRSALVDRSGTSHRLVSSHTTYAAKNAVQPPIAIPPGAKISEALIPADAIVLGSNGREIEPILPRKVTVRTDSTGSFITSRQMIGDTLKVLLPVEIGDQQFEYLFEFVVEGVFVGNR